MPTKPVVFTSPGSHHACRVALLIHELGRASKPNSVSLTCVPAGMGSENEKREFLALNPYGKVPVLKDGDLVPTESNAIMGRKARLRATRVRLLGSPAKEGT
jgi:glutathione S-transferase